MRANAGIRLHRMLIFRTSDAGMLISVGASQCLNERPDDARRPLLPTRA